ncbi:hypothetical protein quinque_004913 [Culex quinquefasciatus]
MKRSRFTHKPSETEEKVVMEYKGRYFEVPRSEYQRRTLSKRKQASKFRPCPESGPTLPPQAMAPTHLPKNNTDMVSSFFRPAGAELQKSMAQSERAQEAPKTPLETHFTLEDCNESQQTIVERPKDCPIPVESAPQDPRLFIDVADSLAQLKSTVTDLIDRTIVDIESKASLSQNVSCETVLMKRALGEGGENSVQNSESYAQCKKAIRTKLYGEIEDIVKRLKDMEFLE